MAYCRGAPSVFDEWAEISGVKGLRWEGLLNDFKATSHYQLELLVYNPHVNASAYGSGPVEVTSGDDNTGFAERLVDALKATLNLPQVDINGGVGIGATIGPASIRASNRTRDYALPAYGWQMSNHSNVRLIHGAWASKIGFSGQRARNATYHLAEDNSTHTISAKEIVLTAGAFNSPKLLMLSGVGPKQHLNDLGIPTILDSPEVGSNLFDHHFSVLEYEVLPGVQTEYLMETNATYRAISEEQYARNGSGPLGITDGPSAISRVPNSVFEAVNDTFHTSLPSDRGQLLYQLVNAPFLSGSPNVSIVSPFVALVQPQAEGYMRLNSSDYRRDPLIYANYYGSPGDKAAILYGIKTLREIMKNKHISDLIVREVFPGANVTSDEGFWHTIQQSAQTFHHPIGTVALGKVLDASWRVKGLEGIRVVDSSTFPSPTTCHIQAVVYAYAHHAARVIRKEDG